MTKKTIKQFIKFCLIGVINTLIDFSVYLILTRLAGLYFLYANIISVILAMTCSFFFNKYWTFKNYHPNIRKQYLQFALVNVIYLLINNLVVWIGVHYLMIGDVQSKILATAITIFWNFGANKLWTFKE